MMSEERFFSEVKAAMYNYSPEVPGAVYGGMRRKLWISQFTKFSLSRLNVYYLLAAFALVGSAVFYFSDSSQALRSHKFERNNLPLMVNVSSENASGETACVSSCATNHASCCASAGPKNLAAADGSNEVASAAQGSAQQQDAQANQSVANADGTVQDSAGDVQVDPGKLDDAESGKRRGRGIRVPTPKK